jgi:hypothetical protein
MMTTLRRFMERERIYPNEIGPDVAGPHQLVAIRTRKSHELTAGSGVRGVVSHVTRYEHAYQYDPESPGLGNSVFLVLDLTAAVAETVFAIGKLPPV